MTQSHNVELYFNAYVKCEHYNHTVSVDKYP